MGTRRDLQRVKPGFIERKDYMNNGNGRSILHTEDLRITQCFQSANQPAFKPPEPAKDGSLDRLEAILRLLLQELGLDLDNEHLRETPKRVARFYREFTQGCAVKPEAILKTFKSKSTELVVVSSIDFYSLCPHHLLVYGGKMHFGYVPSGQIVGVSKIPRLIHALAARPVVQEDLVADVADAFMKVVKPVGCAVKAIGKHDCVAVRGVRCPSTVMTTVAFRGVFREQESLCREFEEAVAEGATCVR
jgi:GTP cyclohydrolase IA